MQSEIPILARGLTHWYPTEGKRLEVLQKIDISARRGEFQTIVGPSGCGKTTLLYILAGLIKPVEADSIMIEGRAVNGPNPESVAFVFQDSGLFFWRSAVENVEFGLEVRQMPKAERTARATKYLRIAGMEGFELRYPSELSGGMKERVALARALALETPILLLDEPFGALDEQTRHLMDEELQRICAEEQKTVLLVTHSLQEAAILSDRITVLSSRPGSVRKTIELADSPRPRSEEEIDSIKEELWELLRNESVKAMKQEFMQ